MAGLLRRRTQRLLIDIDTQFDLVFANGNDYSQLLRNFRRLMAWARVQNVPIISTTVSQRRNSSNRHHAPSCVEGTDGQRKIRYTTLADRIVFGPENRLDLPRHLLNDHQQIVFEKRSEDPFANPRADRLITDVKCEEFIVFGMGLNTAIQPTVLGLLQRNKRVLLVTDAVAISRGRDAIITLRKLEAKGAQLVQTEAVAGLSRLTGPPSIARSHPSLPDIAPTR